MNQAPLDFDSAQRLAPVNTAADRRGRRHAPARDAVAALPAAPSAGTDQPGFELGWDHARHGLVPPPALLTAGTPVCQGWMAGRAVFGTRTLAATRHARSWLHWRTRAWRAGQPFDAQQLTPAHLAQLEVTHCPVLRQPLCGAPDDPLAATLERLHPDAGWVPGHVVMLSRQVAEARAGVDVTQAQRHAARLEREGGRQRGLDAAAWRRLAALGAMAAPLPLPVLAALPLALLPPRHVRLLNTAQQLQVLATQLFARPGWAGRARAVAALLPAPALRTDWHLFVGALVPRVLEAGARAEATALRQALEDAWLQPRVMRRWQQLVLQLGEAGCSDLLRRATAAGLQA